MDAKNVVLLLNELEERGQLVRRRDSEDRRRHRVYITDSGREALEHAALAQQDIEDDVWKPMTPTSATRSAAAHPSAARCRRRVGRRARRALTPAASSASKRSPFARSTVPTSCATSPDVRVSEEAGAAGRVPRRLDFSSLAGFHFDHHGAETNSGSLMKGRRSLFIGAITAATLGLVPAGLTIASARRGPLQIKFVTMQTGQRRGSKTTFEQVGTETKNGKKIGYYTLSCQLTSATAGKCGGAGSFSRGMIYFSFPLSTKSNNFSGTVTGGKGAYSGAKGTIPGRRSARRKKR